MYYSGITGNDGTLDFDVTVQHICNSSWTILSGILSSSLIDYAIDDTAHVEILDDAQVVGTPAFSGAHTLIYSFETQTGDPVDGSIFTYAAPNFTI